MRLVPEAEIERELARMPDRRAVDGRGVLLARERREQVERMLGVLEPDMREVILLHAVEGYNCKQIADRMGLHRTTVASCSPRSTTFPSCRPPSVPACPATGWTPLPSMNATLCITMSGRCGWGRWVALRGPANRRGRPLRKGGGGGGIREPGDRGPIL